MQLFFLFGFYEEKLTAKQILKKSVYANGGRKKYLRADYNYKINSLEVY